MSGHAFTLFDTAIGRCGIAWGERGIVAVQLPEVREAETRARLVRRLPQAREADPPGEAAAAIVGIVALLRGEARDLSQIELDMDGVPEFHCRVYAAARTIPPGTTVTYGELATLLNEPAAARAVGQALGRNPFPIIVPCHRVLAAGGGTGGFSARGGVATKMRMLSIEKANTGNAPGLFDNLPLAAPPIRRS